MKIYVGVTDQDWFYHLRGSKEKVEEVNFWKPGGGSNFVALDKDGLFLFKLHSPYDYIVGGGYFVKFTKLPPFLAWEAFQRMNGTASYAEFEGRIAKYREKNHITDNPQIGCIILTEPFFWEEKDWIPIPSDWSKNTVQGKTYDTSTEIGNKLYHDVIDRVSQRYEAKVRDAERYARYNVNHRLGQGAFRIAVADAYQRRCAITGEKTLPVLEAAHIVPYAEDGLHVIANGILLKSDFHTLFDKGYLTIDTDYRINVSKRLNEDYGNGKDYYKYHGQTMMILPDRMDERPAKEFIEWHNEKVYLG